MASIQTPARKKFAADVARVMKERQAAIGEAHDAKHAALDRAQQARERAIAAAHKKFPEPADATADLERDAPRRLALSEAVDAANEQFKTEVAAANEAFIEAKASIRERLRLPPNPDED